MDFAMKLSIIVPVYNTAADNKLSFCLDSLVNQTIGDYEIIAVNDASPDNSLEILNDYKARYPEKFKVIDSPENRRQGGARNLGIKAAQGEWIGFIDSDDWITPDYYEKLIKRGEETGADVVGCGFTVVEKQTFEVGPIYHDIAEDVPGVLTHEKRCKYLKKPGSMVMKVYRASLIRENDLSFPEKILYEDNCAGPVWAMYIKHLEYVREPLYYYYQHDTSTVHTITVSRCEDRLKASEMMLSEMKSRGFFDEYKAEIESNFTTTYFVNTLFSYMRIKHGKKLSFVDHMKKRMIEEFPDFRSNPEYGRHMDAEQKKYVDILMKSSLRFFVQYSLLWAYRDFRKARNN